MDDDQQFCLRWNNHQSTLISVFDTLLENGTLVDCTLAAEGKFLKAHKVVLSACSPYFAALLSQQYDKHPIFILKDIKFQELRAMMDYMYRGEVNISQDQLAALLKAAESLQIKGLSESRGGSTQKNENVVQKQPVPVVSKSGLTIEHKRPANKHPTSAATESDVSMSREGSTSPTSRKRKKFRRRSIEVNNMDNHDQLSNSSSQSQSIHMTSIPMTAASQITSATSAANVLNVTKKTDHHDSKKDMEQSQADDDEDDDKNDLEPPAQRQKHDMDVSHIKEKMQSTHSELLIEPKNEYDDGQDETVEDLTLDDEELLEDLDQAGPSHGGEGSSQGYAQWQVGQNQDEVFLAAQEAAGQHRDAQDPLGHYSLSDEIEHHPMTYSRGSTFYDPDSYGMDTYYTQNEIEESLLTPQSMAKNTYSNIGSDVESELREIKMLLATDNYIVTEMSPEEFNTRHILYNRFRKWMLENDMKTGMFRKFTERLHLQFCEEKKRDNEKPNAIRCTFIFCCPVCKENIKIVPKMKPLKNGSDGNYYLLSNVIRHLRRVHLKRLANNAAQRRYRTSV